MNMKKFEKALQLFQEVEEVQLKTLGPYHKDYLTTKSNMAVCLMNMNKFEKALQLLQEVEKVQLKTLGLGPSHRYYLTTKKNMACLLYTSDAADE